MKIEIMNYYTLTHNAAKKLYTGSYHIYLPEIDVEIRNVYVIFKNDNFVASLPFSKIFDHRTKKWVRVINFSLKDKEKNEQLKKELFAIVIHHSKEWIKDNLATVIERPMTQAVTKRLAAQKQFRPQKPHAKRTPPPSPQTAPRTRSALYDPKAKWNDMSKYKKS